LYVFTNEFVTISAPDVGKILYVRVHKL